MKYRICLSWNGFLGTRVYLWGNLPVRLATQRKSLRKFNLRPLATTCRSVWPGLKDLVAATYPNRQNLPNNKRKEDQWWNPKVSQGRIQDFEMGVNFYNNVGEIKHYFNIWGLRKKKKEGDSEKGGWKFTHFTSPGSAPVSVNRVKIKLSTSSGFF